MAPTLYYAHASAPCRAVLLTAKALNLELDLKPVDMFKGEHLTPEYLKLNPQHTVPTLVDDGFAIAESRAIIQYLANKYGGGSALYPEEPRARALVDQRLYFDIGTLYQRFIDYYLPQIFAGAPADKDKAVKIEEALQLLENILEGQSFVAGAALSIADLSLVASVTSLEVVHIDYLKYNNIKRWYDTIKKTVPGFKEANEDGMELYKELVNRFLSKK